MPYSSTGFGATPLQAYRNLVPSMTTSSHSRTYEDALAFATDTKGAEEPLALILQEEFIDEPAPGQYVHIREQRVAEWPVAFLARPRRTPRTIADFMAPDAPTNRLDVLRGLA